MAQALHDFFAAWGDPSPDRRAALTEAAIGPGFTYTDPNAPDVIAGRDAYLAYLAQFGDMMPGASARVDDIAEHHGHARATVAFLRDGDVMMTGQYFANLTEGRITRIVGFAGTGGAP